MYSKDIIKINFRQIACRVEEGSDTYMLGIYIVPSPNVNSRSVISHSMILLAVFKNSHSVILITLWKYSVILMTLWEFF